MEKHLSQEALRDNEKSPQSIKTVTNNVKGYERTISPRQIAELHETQSHFMDIFRATPTTRRRKYKTYSEKCYCMIQ